MTCHSYVFWLRGRDGKREMETREPIVAKSYDDAQAQYYRGLLMKIEGKEADTISAMKPACWFGFHSWTKVGLTTYYELPGAWESGGPPATIYACSACHARKTVPFDGFWEILPEPLMMILEKVESITGWVLI